MNLNDIPLPPTPPKRLIQNNSSIISNSKDGNTSSNRPFPPKRHINVKLPVGVIKKTDENKLNDSVSHKRDLFLPSITDKVHLPMNSFNEYQNKKLEALFNATQMKSVNLKIENNNNFDNSSEDSVKRHSRKRKHDYKPELNNNKREKLDKHYRHGSRTMHIKSQVVVKERNDSHSYKRRHRSKHSEDHHRSLSRNHRSKNTNHRDKTPHRSHKFERSSRKRHSSRNNHRRSRSRHRRDSKHRDLPEIKSQVVTVIKNESFVPSNTSEHARSSSSLSVDVALPLESPKSPDEDERASSNSNTAIRNVKLATALANDYLKQLSATLHQMNATYRNVYNKIPICNNNNVVTVSPKEPRMVPTTPSDTHERNGHHETTAKPLCSPSPPVLLQRAAIKMDNLSHISNSSYESKNHKSPHHSLNGSPHSKGSDSRSETKIKPPPPVPKISIFTITNAHSFPIEPALFNESKDIRSSHRQSLMRQAKCHCFIPNPDQWNEGVRSCGSRTNCIMANLHMECHGQFCPAEALCCNRQFTELDNTAYRMFNIEFYYDVAYQNNSGSSPWRIRAKKSIPKHRLIFEVGGALEWSDTDPIEPISPSIWITDRIRIDPVRDLHSYIHYVCRTECADEANVVIEQWIVGGRLRLGLFAACQIDPGQLLMVYYRSILTEPNSIIEESDVLATIQHLIRSSDLRHYLSRYVDLMLNIDESRRSSLFQYFGSIGGPFLLCCALDMVDNDELLMGKCIDLLMSCVHIIDRPIGLIDVQPIIDRLVPYGVNMSPIINWLSTSIMDNDGTAPPSLVQNNHDSMIPPPALCSRANVADILHCRLPPYWSSRQCSRPQPHTDQSMIDTDRVYFFHRVTKSMQWDMPVYPWEAASSDDNEADIYDYNGASLHQVTHDEIGQMYINLNQMYEQKQRKMQLKLNQLKRKKDNIDLHKKDSFKRRIMAVITNLLKPYRNPMCQEGKIESDDDLHYLTNKLAQTIMFKELKILNERTEHLEVTAQVETKTKTYVKMYMQSRGNIYKRPTHYSLSNEHKTDHNLGAND